MAGYARFRRARKGLRTYGRKRRIGRSGGGIYRKKKRSGRYVTVSYTRDSEKKYHDRTYMSFMGMNKATPTGLDLNGGTMFYSTRWKSFDFGSANNTNTSTSISNNMLAGLRTGVSVRNRIANKINVKYIKGSMTFQAGVLDGNATYNQGGEVVGTSSVGPIDKMYARTSIRYMIVKDLQVNGNDDEVNWEDVMDAGNDFGGIHSELNIANMGRFVVLEDKSFELKGDNPQKTITWWIKGSDVGQVRYHVSDETARTNVGIYLVWAAYTKGSATGMTYDVEIPNPVGHSRTCFVDN